MPRPISTLPDLSEALSDFAAERDWEQFHSPKNLAMALSVEAGEVLEHFQWLTEESSRDLPAKMRAAVAAELADVLIYLVRLADQMNIDLLAAASNKIATNSERYPVAKARGSAKKHTDL